MASQPSTTSAAYFASLHIPGNPIVIPNIWDISSLNTILSLNAPSPSSSSSSSPPNSSPPIKAIATASYAIASSLNLADSDLSLGANLIRIRQLAPYVRKAGLPLTVDIQDGYGERLDEVVRAVVEAGAVGANVEDLKDAGNGDLLWTLDEQVERLRRVMKIARESGCEGFVLNARCDVLNPASRPPRSHSSAHSQIKSSSQGDAVDDGDGDDDKRLLNETIKRGKGYLEAGATTVFVWGGPTRGLRDHEIRILIKEFGGRLAVKLGGDGNGDGTALSVAELATMGVARITVGPSLYLAACRAVREGAERIVGGGRL
ncbi:Phosphoenolpyruvate/pyruvate domain-containing protein [Xylariaceae sp. AK1471]|nr:Phosphoenolpyruvate/pyruvate domain-containing protein [Xylariaceae sp. AK1471]